VAVDPTTSTTAYATFSGFTGFGDGLGHVFKTTNGGSAWTDMSGDLPNTPVNFVVIDPDASSTLFVATDVGVFYSTNNGTSWTSLVTGLPRVAVLGLTLHNASRTLRASTHGRGAWDINIASFGPLTPTSVVSRMTHGSSGTYDVNLPLIGTRGVEPRSSAGNYTLVFTFVNNLTSVASASVSSGAGSVNSTVLGPNASLNLTANQYQVNLTGVSNQQYITLTLHTVQDSKGNTGDVIGPQMGVLIGDTTANGSVNSSDIAQTQSQSGQLVTTGNFREDVTVNGTINSSDIALVQSKSGTALPTSP
jgi:hypothetical protein